MKQNHQLFKQPRDKALVKISSKALLVSYFRRNSSAGISSSTINKQQTLTFIGKNFE
jgi:hypothetical protein